MKYLIILLVVTLFGCNATRRAQRQVLNLQQKHPEILAAGCHDFYPPILRPGKPDTLNRPDSSLQRIADSLTGKVAYLQGQAENAEKRADSAIFAALLNKDTSCARLIRSLKTTITSQKNEINRLTDILADLKHQLNYQKEHPLTISIPTYVTDSAFIKVLTVQRDNALQNMARKDGEIKQLNKTIKRLVIMLGLAVISGVAAFFLKPKII